MKTTRHKASPCPHCGQPIEASTAVLENARPQRGDFGVCWRCGGLLRYRADLSVGAAAPWELTELPGPDRCKLLELADHIRQRVN